MKHVLIVARGKIARIFIESLLEKYHNNNHYFIVSDDSEIISLLLGYSFNIYNFDPTSEFRLSSVISGDLDDIFIILENPKERDEVFRIVRKLAPNTPIKLSCESRAEINPDLLKDELLDTVSSSFVVARALIDKIPNIPLVAHGFGLNKGEIMQINIPFGSAYSYISAGSISQIGWKIVGIYRKNTFILADDATIIEPNDSILVAGNHVVLNNIYKRIGNKGNFPAPFGRDICVYVDFKASKEMSIRNTINDALWLHNHLKNEKLIINIINPNNLELFDEINNIQDEKILVQVHYKARGAHEIIQNETHKKIGLIVLPTNALYSKRIRRAIFKANKPVLKIGNFTRLNELKAALVLLSSESNHIQNIAYAIMDFASQLDIAMKMYEFDIYDEFSAPIALYCNNIARIFNKKIDIERSDSRNPILWLLKSSEKLIQFIPLEREILRGNVSWFLRSNMDYLSLNIDKNPQILMPI